MPPLSVADIILKKRLFSFPPSDEKPLPHEAGCPWEPIPPAIVGMNPAPTAAPAAAGKRQAACFPAKSSAQKLHVAIIQRKSV